MGSELGVGVPESTSFAQALGTLKREGSNVLLVGEGTKSSHRQVCDRFLGSMGSTQQRIVVTTGGDRVGCRECGADRTHYIVLTNDTAQSTPVSNAAGTVTEHTVLGMVGREFVERVDDLESQVELVPSALRVCVDSIADLLERYDSELVFRLLHVLTTRTRRSRGMGHYHLPIDRDAEAVRLFEPLFDAVVSLRSAPDGPEHRWHLRDRETPTDWIPL